MNVLSLFDGMSCARIALDRAGVKVDNYYASEIDKFAIRVAQANYPDTVQLGDVESWEGWDIDWASIDIIFAGSPCQGFSLSGKQLAFNDPRSALFFTFVDILNHVRSINPKVKFLLENVKMKSDYLDIISEYLEVEPVFINSNLVSAQSRPRYYWTDFSEDIQPPEPQGIDYTSVVNEADLKPATARKGNPRPVKFTGEQFLCLTASYSKGVRADGRPALATEEGSFDDLKDAGKVRMLTPLECERLQTVPEGYTDHVSKTQRYKMLGNGWTIDVIVHLLKYLEP